MWSLPSDPPRGVILTPNDCKILDFAKLSEPRVGWALVPKSATDCHLVLATRTTRCSSDRENQSNKKASFVDIKLKFDFKTETFGERGKSSFYSFAQTHFGQLARFLRNL